MTDKMVPLIQAEEVLEVKLHDLLLTPGIEIHTKISHGQVYVDPNDLARAKHQVEIQKKGENGKT
jgi:hypothetical protein